jgi:hypothetical protein
MKAFGILMMAVGSSVIACGGGDKGSDGGGTGGKSGGGGGAGGASGGGGQSIAELCAAGCDKAAPLKCPSDGSCAADCEAGATEFAAEYPDCSTQAKDRRTCEVNRPASDWACDPSGFSSVKEGVCATEVHAVFACINAGGGGSAGSGGTGVGGSSGAGGVAGSVDAGGGCPYTNDGACDEPDICPAGTDTADCAGAADAGP